MSSPESPPNAPADPSPPGAGDGSHETHHDQVDAERDSPPSIRIMSMIGILTVVVIMSVIGVWQLVLMTSDAEVQSKELTPDNPVLAELRARDQGRLEAYDAVDRDAGRYQIPVERAMDLLVRQPGLIAARAAPSGSAASPHDSHSHAPGWAHAPAMTASAAPSGSAQAPVPAHSGGH